MATIDDSKKLLIADDEPNIRKLVRITLEDEDYEILEAGDGEEALAVAREQKPQMILLDVTMPKRSGLDVCRALKDDPETAGITVVMLTARVEESDLEQGRQAGADDYFVKPFSPIALLRKVDEALA